MHVGTAARTWRDRTFCDHRFSLGGWVDGGGGGGGC